MKIADSCYQACLYFTSAALARKVERLATEAWRPTGLAPSHGYLLLLVLGCPGIQPTAVAKQLLLAPSTVTRLVEKLEANGLVRRQQQGKTTLLHPTEAALELRPRLDAAVQAFVARCTEDQALPYPADLVRTLATAHDKLPG